MEFIKDYHQLNYNEYCYEINSHILKYLKNETIFETLINLDVNHIYKKQEILSKAIKIENIQIVEFLLEKFDYSEDELKNALRIIITKNLDVIKKCWKLIKEKTKVNLDNYLIRLTNYNKLKKDIIEYFISEKVFKIPNDNKDLINLIEKDARYLIQYYIEEKKIDIKKFKNKEIVKYLCEYRTTVYHHLKKYFITYKMLFEIQYQININYRLIELRQSGIIPTEEEKQIAKEYFEKNNIPLIERMNLNKIFGNLI